jgi:hypothetical protein
MTIGMIAIIIAVFAVVVIGVIIITIRIAAVVASLCDAIAAIGATSRIVSLMIGCTGAQKQWQHTEDKQFYS